MIKNQVFKLTKRTVLAYLKDNIDSFSGLGIRSFRELEEFFEQREEEGYRVDPVNPEPPPPGIVAVRHGGHKVKVPNPVVIVDTREQEGFAYTFDRFGKKWFAGVERAKLDTGDYSVKGLEHEIAIERKSLPDLAGSTIRDRKRFLDVCRRLSSLKRKAIVIEASLARAKTPYEESGAHPNAVVGTLLAAQERWGIQVIWADSPPLAEEIVAHILSKYYVLRWLEKNKLPAHFVDGDV